jgi:hypothetical protein
MAFRPGDFKSPAYAIPPPGQDHQGSMTFRARKTTEPTPVSFTTTNHLRS